MNNQVPTNGLLAHYTIQSDVGVFQANSTEMLKIRVAEIPAIQELTKTSKTKVFAQSLATNAARPVAAAGQMVMHAGACSDIRPVRGFARKNARRAGQPATDAGSRVAAGGAA